MGEVIFWIAGFAALVWILFIKDDTRCANCGGRGTLKANGFPYTCPDCNGSGTKIEEQEPD